MVTLKKTQKYGGVTLKLILEVPEGTPLEWPDEIKSLIEDKPVIPSDLVSLSEYAEMHGKAPKSVHDMVQRGGLNTAVKIGRNWLVNRSEPYPDRRVKLGSIVGSKRKTEGAD